MHLPTPRGQVSQSLAAVLRAAPDAAEFDQLQSALDTKLSEQGDVLFDDDLQLSLFMLYELHYRGFEDADENWEWDPGLLALRQRIEAVLEERLRAITGPAPQAEPQAANVADALFALAADDSGPSVSRYVARNATKEQAREFLILKSMYQLKEADPHTWAIPKLDGRAKAAMVEIQADEYGGGSLPKMHSELYRATMRGLGLDDSFGAYVDKVPAIFLASVNLISLFGMHRRLRGAITGHLAIYEMTSSIPNAAYARGFRRLGFESPVTDYFDEHVEADAVHEQIAGRDLAGGLVEAEPQLMADVFFGAQAAAAVDVLAGKWQLNAWQNGISALYEAAEVNA